VLTTILSLYCSNKKPPGFILPAAGSAVSLRHSFVRYRAVAVPGRLSKFYFSTGIPAMREFAGKATYLVILSEERVEEPALSEVEWDLRKAGIATE
jgi:hypothetical protein